MSYLQKWQSNKAFRKLRFSSPWKSWKDFTENGILQTSSLAGRHHLSSARLHKRPVDLDGLSQYLLAVQLIDRPLRVVILAELEKRIALVSRKRMANQWTTVPTFDLKISGLDEDSPSGIRFFDPDSDASS